MKEQNTASGVLGVSVEKNDSPVAALSLGGELKINEFSRVGIATGVAEPVMREMYASQALAV